MNLPSFRPNPPFLLGSLMGAAKASEEGVLRDEGLMSLAAQQNIDIELEEPMAEEVSQDGFEDTYRLNGSLNTASADAGGLVDTVEVTGQKAEPEEVDLFLEDEGIQELSIDLEDFDVGEPGPGPDRPGEGYAEEIVSDIDLSFSDASQMEEIPVVGSSGTDDVSEDEPVILLEDEVLEDAEAPLDLGEVASAVEDEDEGLDLQMEVAEEGAPFLSEGAHIPHGDTVALEREFLGLDLDLEPVEGGEETGELPTGQISGDELILEKAIDETPLISSTKAVDDAPLVDFESRTVDDQLTLEQEFFEDIESLDLGEAASAVDLGSSEIGLPAEDHTEKPLPPEEGALLPHGDTLALDRELLGLDLELEPMEDDAEGIKARPEKVQEDEIVLGDLDEPFRLDEMASGPLRERPTTEPPSSEEGALLPHGDTLALDRELLGLDLELEPMEDDAEDIEARPERGAEDKPSPGVLEEPFDLGELESPLSKEKPAPPAEGLSHDDTMALDLEALGLDLELEP